MDLWRCSLCLVFVLVNLDTSFRKILTTSHFHTTNDGGIAELSSMERKRRKEESGKLKLKKCMKKGQINWNQIPTSHFGAYYTTN